MTQPLSPETHELIQEIVNAEGAYEYQNLFDYQKDALHSFYGDNWVRQVPSLRYTEADLNEEACRLGLRE